MGFFCQVAQTFRPSETNNICFFKWAGCFILVFAWSECLSYLTVFTVISCRYFRNYVVFIRHVLSLLWFAKLKKTGFEFTGVFIPLLARFPKRPNPVVAPPFLQKCLYRVRVITVFTVFRLLTDFVCLYTNMSFDFPL